MAESNYNAKGVSDFTSNYVAYDGLYDIPHSSVGNLSSSGILPELYRVHLMCGVWGDTICAPPRWEQLRTRLNQQLHQIPHPALNSIPKWRTYIGIL